MEAESWVINACYLLLNTFYVSYGECFNLLALTELSNQVVLFATWSLTLVIDFLFNGHV